MKKFLIAITSMAVFSAAAIAGEGAWLNDFEAAKAQAKAENKPIFINFTGSDWCGWCIKLEKEVFTQKEFQDYAKEHLILMEADFPKKSEQPEALKKQNKALEKTYLNGGYPTVYLLDAEGKKLSDDLGELKGGLEGYLKTLTELVEKNKAK